MMLRLAFAAALLAAPAPDEGCCDVTVKRRVSSSTRLWPSVPERPRIEFVGSLVSEASLGKGAGTFSRFRRIVAGTSPEHLALQRPHDVAVDSRDRLYVTDGARRAVLVFDVRTRSGREVGSAPGPGRLSKPMGLGMDHRDNLYVADQGAKRIVVFKPDGSFLRAYGGEAVLLNPVDVAVDTSTGVVYVADSYLHQVVAFRPDGTILRRLGRNDGDVAAKRRAVSRAPLTTHGEKEGDNAVVAMDSAMRSVLGHAGKYSSEPRDLVENRGGKPGEMRYPSFLTVGGDGAVYVSDAMNFRVQVFDRSGRFLSQIGRLGDGPGFFARPKGVAVDSENHVYVVDAAFNNVQMFDRDGKLLLAFAAMGRGPGELWLPLGLFIDRHDRVLISDRFNNRVQIFNYLTERQGDLVLEALTSTTDR